MKYLYQRKIVFLIPFVISTLHANEALEIGCSSSLKKEDGCSEKSIFKIEEEKDISIKNEINITKTLKSVEVTHQNEELIIIRKMTKKQNNSLLDYIEPMSISTVKTVGELETLTFIQSLKKKKSRLLLDTRESRFYKEHTIPGSINLPHTMIQEDSKYFKEVLTLLGINEVRGKWQVKNAPHLLIFDNGAMENKASKVIKSLLKLSYPADKILYYRGGIESWRSLGLTLY